MKRTPLKRTGRIKNKSDRPLRPDRIPLAIARPSEMKKEPVAVKVFAKGREVCNLLCKAGRDEYERRKDVMFNNQGRKCGLIISPQCKERNGKWPRNEIQFGHPHSRGMGSSKRDDRLEIDGKPSQAMALCPFCNSMQGSRPITDFIDAL